ncbi:hypothetical protein AYO44_13310 [Planctomycetaceae bacterium SCGC AG-212-F19]|nr:hypothetical protein AYO44_13310 [Planctomycetaceae bacterium SCGC AG-212-F19]
MSSHNRDRRRHPPTTTNHPVNTIPLWVAERPTDLLPLLCNWANQARQQIPPAQLADLRQRDPDLHAIITGTAQPDPTDALVVPVTQEHFDARNLMIPAACVEDGAPMPRFLIHYPM